MTDDPQEIRWIPESPTREDLADALREAVDTIERLANQIGLVQYVAQIARLRALVNNAGCAESAESFMTVENIDRLIFRLDWIVAADAMGEIVTLRQKEELASIPARRAALVAIREKLVKEEPAR